MRRKSWLFRPRPNDINRLQDFHEENFIGVGWPGLGSLEGLEESDIRSRLEMSPYGANLSALATLKIITFRMNIGDYVVVPDEGQIYFAQITGDYFHKELEDGSEDDRYPHCRLVEWFALVVKRSDLPEGLQKSTRSVRTVADLTSHTESIDAIVSGQSMNGAVDSKAIPLDLVEEARSVLRQELTNDDPVVRIKAARVILEWASKKED